MFSALFCFGLYCVVYEKFVHLYLAYALFLMGFIWNACLYGRIIYNNLTNKSVERATYEYYQNPGKHRHANHPVIKAFAEPKLEWMVKHLPDFAKYRVLDVGGGCGYWSNYMVKYCPNVHVMDNSLEQLKLNSLPDNQKHVGDAYKILEGLQDLPEHLQTFDVVFASNLLHHLDRPVDAIKQYRKAASKYVVIMEPVTNNPVLWFGCQYPAWEFGVKKYSEAYVRGMIKQAGGLEILHSTFIGGMLLANRTPTWMLPLTFYRSTSRFSYFQMYICKAV